MLDEEPVELLVAVELEVELLLELPDLHDDAGALVEQADDLLVQRVDLRAQTVQRVGRVGRLVRGHGGTCIGWGGRGQTVGSEG